MCLNAMSVSVLARAPSIIVLYALCENCRMFKVIEKLSRYRTIEQLVQNCRIIGDSSKVIAYEHMVSMYKLYP